MTTEEHINVTIKNLCQWIGRTLEDSSSEELAALPEVIQGLAILIKATKSNVFNFHPNISVETKPLSTDELEKRIEANLHSAFQSIRQRFDRLTPKL